MLATLKIRKLRNKEDKERGPLEVRGPYL